MRFEVLIVCTRYLSKNGVVRRANVSGSASWLHVWRSPAIATVLLCIGVCGTPLLSVFFIFLSSDVDYSDVTRSDLELPGCRCAVRSAA
jgi:hypothetical protein